MMPPESTIYAQTLGWTLTGSSIFAFSVNTNAVDNPIITIWVYAAITLVFSIINTFIMPNIKGLTIVEIQ